MVRVTADTSDEGTPPDYITWMAPDGSATVRLATSVIRRMNVEIMRGFGATRRRGTETGGILIGQVENSGTLLVTVKDYEIVPSEYAYGPSYHLSAADRASFEDAVAKRQTAGSDARAIGFFRSHTREGLSLDPADIDLFSEYFSGGPAVVLLVKPFATRAGTASFFVARAGAALRVDTAAVEFPFSEKPIPQPEPVPVVPKPAPAREPQAAPSPAAASQPAPVERKQPLEGRPESQAAHDDASTVRQSRVVSDLSAARARSEQREQARGFLAPDDRPLFAQHYPAPPASPVRRAAAFVAFTLAALFFGSILGYQYAGGSMEALVPVGSPRVPPTNPYALGLSVQRQGESLLIRWNHHSDAVAAGGGAVLTVTEDETSHTVNLPRQELQSGVVLYPNRTGSARIRLEVFLGKDRSLSETVAWSEGPSARQVGSKMTGQ